MPFKVTLPPPSAKPSKLPPNVTACTTGEATTKPTLALSKLI
ncbi:hypothetical protein PQ676_00305 [Rickettsia felis]|nr:hypothetical protein [Rickettsia felis]MDE8610720.1 hypothetical protein [Rickettsia felis]